MTVVVTGGEGTIGRALRLVLPDAVFLGRHACDISTDAGLRALGQVRPETVLHAAALTDHHHPDAGQIIATNILGTERIARWCRDMGARMVYLSTHYVYPGTTGDYRESDVCGPIGTYAWSKLAGEGWAMLPNDWLIVRGSWYTPEKLAAWAMHGALTDAWCGRERPDQAARKIAHLIARSASGVYNIGGPRRTFHQIALDEGYFPERTTRAMMQLPYPFPEDSSVNTEKYDAEMRWFVR